MTDDQAKSIEIRRLKQFVCTEGAIRVTESVKPEAPDAILRIPVIGQGVEICVLGQIGEKGRIETGQLSHAGISRPQSFNDV